MTIPRSEHPKPQFLRQDWQNLNGEWAFEIDNGRSGEARGLSAADAKLSDTITVPFCPESKLSGVEHKDFMYGVWYQRHVNVDADKLNGRVFLHFGAVDYRCTAYVNGQKVGTHLGGYVSFRFEITDAVKAGDNVITVYAEDDTKDPTIPCGKQSDRYDSYSCFYTRTTGIWQTVWLEFTPKAYIASTKYFTNIEAATVTVQATLIGKGDFKIAASYEGKEMGSASLKDVTGEITVTVPLKEVHLWEPGHGRLYDLALTFGEDQVASYTGLRKVGVCGEKIMFNGKSFFMRMILDQGFYPDGIYTAPSDEALKNDILLSMAYGFTGARLHEKIFEERFLYHCDKLGYVVWGEFPNWGMNINLPESYAHFLSEWCEELNRDFNHPAIMGWCPFNETWQVTDYKPYAEFFLLVRKITETIDPTRLFLETSGGFHVDGATAVYDAHDYEQNPAAYAETYMSLNEGKEPFNKHMKDYAYYKKGMPYFVSEMGGIGWEHGQGGDTNTAVDHMDWSGTGDSEIGWGYGEAPRSMREFVARFHGLCRATMQNPHICGLCYTQLTDVEQEHNGLYYYDRTVKFDPAVLRTVLDEKAAIED